MEMFLAYVALLLAAFAVLALMFVHAPNGDTWLDL